MTTTETVVVVVVGGIAAFFLLGRGGPLGAGVDLAAAAPPTAPQPMRDPTGGIAGLVSQMPGGQYAVAAQKFISNLVSGLNGGVSKEWEGDSDASRWISQSEGRRAANYTTTTSVTADGRPVTSREHT